MAKIKNDGTTAACQRHLACSTAHVWQDEVESSPERKHGSGSDTSPRSASGSAVKAVRHLADLEVIPGHEESHDVSTTGLNHGIQDIVQKERAKADAQVRIVEEKLRQAQRQYETRLNVTAQRFKTKSEEQESSLLAKTAEIQVLHRKLEAVGTKWRSKYRSKLDELARLKNIVQAKALHQII